VSFKSRVAKRSVQVLMAVVEAIAAILLFIYISGSNLQPLNIWLITFVLLSLTFILLVFHALSNVTNLRYNKFCIFCGAKLVKSAKLCSKCLKPQPEPPV